jgi:hypothetical protein
MVDEQVDLRRRPRDVRIGVEVGDAIFGEDVLAVAPSGGNGAPVPEQMKRSFRR